MILPLLETIQFVIALKVAISSDIVAAQTTTPIDPVNTILNADNGALALAIIVIVALFYSIRVLYNNSRNDQKEIWQMMRDYTEAIRELKHAVERAHSRD